MSDERPPGVLGGLPRSRPHRRSDKRAAASPPSTEAVPRPPRPADAMADDAVPEPGTQTVAAARGARAKPVADGAPPRPASPAPPHTGAGPLGTAVQAAAELAEIGLMASARALRSAVSRLPRR